MISRIGKHYLCICDYSLLPMDVEECVKFAGVWQAGPGDGQHTRWAHGQRLQSEVTRICELSEEALDTAPAAHTRHQLRERTEHLTWHHHQGHVQVLLLQHAVTLQERSIWYGHQLPCTLCLQHDSCRLAMQSSKHSLLGHYNITLTITVTWDCHT